MKVNIVIIQPNSFIDSLAFLDDALFIKHEIGKLCEFSYLSKNRFRRDCVNIILGAHLGVDREIFQNYCCVIFNLEQLGERGAPLSKNYLSLIENFPVIEYDKNNEKHYSNKPMKIEYFNNPNVVAGAIPISERKIDLLFYGNLNERRRNFIQKIQNSGVTVSVIAKRVYGPERDRIIVNSKAVLNCHFYEASVFEQSRVSHALSLGTPVISEASPAVSSAFRDCVSWVSEQTVGAFFKDYFLSPEWHDAAQKQLALWPMQSGDDVFRKLASQLSDIWEKWDAPQGDLPIIPSRINIGSGKDYKPGWLNIDVLEVSRPDLVIDFSRNIDFPISAKCFDGADVFIEKGSIDFVYANNVLEHIPDLIMFMTNIIDMMRVGAVLEIEVPYEKAKTAWQDPTHVRAMNEMSWVYYTNWFWYIGWFYFRFESRDIVYLDAHLQPCNADRAEFMRVRLKKVETSADERTLARTMRSDFGPDILE